MSDLCSAIRDDIRKYVRLCELYGEKVHYDQYGEDCYGEHSKYLSAKRDGLEYKRVDKLNCLLCKESMVARENKICDKCFDKEQKARGSNGKS